MTINEIAHILTHFVHSEQFTELRALDVGAPGRTFAGWFDGAHLIDLARDALAITRQASRVYFIPNPINPRIASKRLNTFLNVHRGFALTHDDDVVERRYLIVDVDPVRFAETNDPCPSSARELAFARHVARDDILKFTKQLGFGEPIWFMSGNGIHLVYTLNPPLEVKAWRAANDPLATLLKGMSQRFTRTGAIIDENTFNPSRMIKVPGTLVKKGLSTRERPHRVVKVMRIPDGWPQPQRPAITGLPETGTGHVEPNRKVGTEPERPHKSTNTIDQPALFDASDPGTALR